MSGNFLRTIVEDSFMPYKATFFRGEILTKPLPELKFNGRVLIPYDNRVDGQLIVLFFSADTVLPVSKSGWEQQLDEQGYILAGYGRSLVDDPHPYVFVRAWKVQA